MARRRETTVLSPSRVYIGVQRMFVEPAIGRDDGYALVVGVIVDDILCPSLGQVVHMQHHHSAGGGMLIPAFLANLLHNIELVGVSIVDNLVGLSTLAQWLEDHMHGCLELDERVPP